MKALQELEMVVLAGGPGSERKVSMASGLGVFEALKPHCARLELVELTGTELAFENRPALAFNVIHGTYGEDGRLQEQLEARGIPYTGAGVASSRLAFDKILSKERFVAHGVRTPSHHRFLASEALERAGEVAFPCVVKPPREGSSVGVHIVEEPGDYAAAVEDAARYGDELMVEHYIRGKELTVGILGDGALPIVHIQPRSGFYDMNNKYPWLNDQGGTDYFCPADLSAEVTAAVQAEALGAHRALGVEIYSRVDLLLDADDVPWVLEVNTIPGMTSSSLLPKAARATGIEFDELCLRIARASLALRG